MEAADEKVRNEEDENKKAIEKSLELARKLEERLKKARETAVIVVEEASIDMEPDGMIFNTVPANDVRTGDIEDNPEATPGARPSLKQKLNLAVPLAFSKNYHK